MFIQTEQTPNPATLKFIPGRPVMNRGNVDFRSAQEAKVSILASSLFKINGVGGVFLGSDFLSVTKSAGGNWAALKPQILAAIMDHYLSGLPVIEEREDSGESATDSGDSEIVKQIKEILDTRVRPAVAQDGGDIVFSSFEDGIVYLKMRGACEGCPSSAATLKSGIENLLRHYVPEVRAVEQA